MPLAGILIGGGAALLQGGLGIGEMLSASKLAKNNIRPTYTPDPAYANNLRIAQYLASEGLPASTKQNYYQQASRGFTGGVNAILEGGGNINQIAGLYSNEQDNFDKILAEDAQQKLRNIGGAEQAALDVAAENQKAWFINQYQPYADKAALAAQEKTAGIQNATGAVNTLSGAVSNYATSQSYQKYYQQYLDAFKNSGTSTIGSGAVGGIGAIGGLASLAAPPKLNLGKDNAGFGLSNYSPLGGGIPSQPNFLNLEDSGFGKFNIGTQPYNLGGSSGGLNPSYYNSLIF